MANRDSIHWLLDSYNTAYQATVSSAVYAASVAYSQAMAAHILAYGHMDGGYNCQLANFPTSYIPPVGDGFWVQTGAQTALQPYWGDNRPFVMEDTMASILPAGPPDYSTEQTSEFYAYAYDVYNKRLNLTEEDSLIAVYWGDGGASITPPGHSISMLTQVLKLEDANLAEAIRAYAQLGLAVSDAFLVCWRTKFAFNLMRPITYSKTLNLHGPHCWPLLHFQSM